MAIGYTNPGWANGTAPALTGGVGGTLTALSDALATISTGLDSGAGGVTPTKIFNDKNDGPSSGLDADTVSGYGIGASALVTTTPNTALLGGFYGATGARTGAPFSWTDNIIIAAEWVSSTYCVQIGISVSQADTRQDNGIKVRSSTNGGSTWTAWNLLWNNLNDGNGGQPPMPKANQISSSTPGFSANSPLAQNATLVLAAGGTWFVEECTYGTTYDSTSPSLTGQTSAVINGGSTLTQRTAGGMIRAIRIT